MNKLKAIYRFYRDGFAEMTIGRKLWALIIIKLAIMFLILRPFFFPNRLKENFENDSERAEEVRRQLSRPTVLDEHISDHDS